MGTKNFLKKIGLQANNIKLYEEAFTHPSFAHGQPLNKFNYQRLEFLGDALLSKAVSLHIFNLAPKLDEGEMSILRSNVVNTYALSKLARALNFNQVIKFGKSAQNLNNNDNILADVFESFIGALFLDKGQKELEAFLTKTIYPYVNQIRFLELKNPKTLLQEFLQSESRKIIKYQTHEVKNGFTSKVFHDQIVFGHGQGKSKKEAEISAAKNALKKLENKER